MAMTLLVGRPACSKRAPLQAVRTSAATPIQKIGSDPSASGLSFGCNAFAAAVLGTCFHEARTRIRITTWATATKLDFNGKIEGDATGKGINGKTNSPAVAPAEPIRDGYEPYEENTFKVPSLLVALLPPEMRSADPHERDRYLCTALEIGLKALINAADSKSTVGPLLREQLQSVMEQQNKNAEMLDKQMTDIKHVLHVDEKLQALQQETVDAKEAGTAKGLVFEAAGYEALVAIAKTFGDRVEHTGSAPVSGTKRKVGDHVIHVNQPGAGDLRLVVEQKAGKCSKNKLLGQMKSAMEFREAQAAIGLIQRNSLGKRQAAYEQHGPDWIIVAVDFLDDSEQTDSDWFALEVAYRTLRSQVVADAIQRHTVGGVDVAEVKTLIMNVERELNIMRKVKLNASAARTSLENIESTVAELVQNVRKELAEMENALAEAASEEKR